MGSVGHCQSGWARESWIRPGMPEAFVGERDVYADCEVQFAKLLNGEADAVAKLAPDRGHWRKLVP